MTRGKKYISELDRGFIKRKKEQNIELKEKLKNKEYTDYEKSRFRMIIKRNKKFIGTD